MKVRGKYGPCYSGRRGNKNNGHASPQHKPPKYVSYCPECSNGNAQAYYPLMFPSTVKMKRRQRVSCKNGHTWRIV